ncbi:hypothetical protein BJ742DRAFT_802367 [Cladochytrium replicatum]|nr:hypothetical protein BJ742DRAFT_802367 [Cladochytrium replicatum]
MGNHQSTMHRGDRRYNRSPQSASSSPVGRPIADPLLRFFHPLTVHEVTVGSRVNMQQYYLIKRLFKSNFMGVTAEALIAGINVLDAGSSTGLWLEEMERDFPYSNFAGVDLAINLWHDTERIPESSTVDLVESSSLWKIPFRSSTFDYVHEQTQLYVTPVAKWPHVIEELSRVLKPGGYLDIVELDPFPAISPSPFVSAYISRVQTIMRAGGQDIHGASKIADIVEASGSFTEVEVYRCSAPIGWDGEFGALWRVHLKEGYLALRHVLGLAVEPNSKVVASEEEFRNFLDAYFDDCADAQSYCSVYRITARKKFSY